MLVKMVVKGLTIDPVTNAPIVVLREAHGERLLPIWIGVIEASAIAFEMEKLEPPRPQPHHLLKKVLDLLGVRVRRVGIVDLREKTFFASITLEHDNALIEVDARPSDAIVLALRSAAPLFCDKGVLERAQEALAPAVGEVLVEASAGAAAVVEVDEESEEDVEESQGASTGGPRPLFEDGSRSWLEVLQDLEPAAFGKYKM